MMQNYYRQKILRSRNFVAFSGKFMRSAVIQLNDIKTVFFSTLGWMLLLSTCTLHLQYPELECHQTLQIKTTITKAQQTQEYIVHV